MKRRRIALRYAFDALRATPLRDLIASTFTPSDLGHRLDPDMALLLWFSRREPDVQWHAHEPAEAREQMEAMCTLVGEVPREMHEVRDLSVGHLAARLYMPSASTDGRLLVFFHGGGWVVGSVDSHDPVCRVLADEGRQRVLSVDYRLAPEHRFPTAAEDATYAVRWARTHADELGASPERIAVGGDSAGGNLAAVVCLALRSADEPQPAFQLLIYPATDCRRVTPSHRALSEGYILDARTLDWYQGHYQAPVLDPRCSPLLAADHRGLAPAIIANAGFDPLRDDGVRYGEALLEAGVAVDRHDFDGLVHGFASMGGVIPTARRALVNLGLACERAHG